MAFGRNDWTKTACSFLLVVASMFLVSAAKYKRPSFCDMPEMSSEDKKFPKSFLWSLSERVPPAYFFGTIHVPYTRVWDFVPDNVKKAFTLSDNVFFELDLMDPYTIAALANCQMLPSGESLSDVLPKDVYQRLKRHLDYVRNVMPSWLTADQRGRGLYADYLFNAITGNWERKRPVWVMLMVNSLTESDIKSRGIPVLDLYLAQEAQRMDKRSGAVERVEEQCVPLNGLNFTQVLFALNQTLLQQESLRSGDPFPGYTTDDLIKHYNCGDLDSVYVNGPKDQEGPLSIANVTAWPHQDMILSTRNIDQYFKNELVHKRNVRMGQRVLQLLKTYPDESFFFAFGAGHFLGENTVFDYVQSQGYKIEQIAVTKKLYGVRKTHHHPRYRHKVDTSSVDSTGLWRGQDPLRRISSVSRLSGRRRYRKQRPNHPHHHPGVQLLQTSTSASAKIKAQRTFNDLWVKLDSDKRTTSRHFKPPAPTQEIEDLQNSLRTWYTNNNIAAKTQNSFPIYWIVCFILLYWNKKEL